MPKAIARTMMKIEKDVNSFLNIFISIAWQPCSQQLWLPNYLLA
jgi:hypothetical protein